MYVGFHASGIGCSVKAITQLGDKYLRTGYEPEGHYNRAGRYIRAKKVKYLDVYTKKGLKAFIDACRASFTGVTLFSDNAVAGNGQKLADWLKKNGYKIQESLEYTNLNHDSKCKVWILYHNLEPKAGKNGQITYSLVRGKKKKTLADLEF